MYKRQDTDIINESYRTKLFKINKDSFNGSNKHLKRSQFNLYTDGSKLEGKCGAGYSIYKYRKQVYGNSAQLPQVCTVFQAEILGIKIACEQLLNNFDTYKPKYIKVFSDSQAAILALDNTEMTSQLVRETKFILNKLASKVQRLSVVWIKAHVGHEGNEEVD